MGPTWSCCPKRQNFSCTRRKEPATQLRLQVQCLYLCNFHTEDQKPRVRLASSVLKTFHGNGKCVLKNGHLRHWLSNLNVHENHLGSLTHMHIAGPGHGDVWISWSGRGTAREYALKQISSNSNPSRSRLTLWETLILSLLNEIGEYW